MQKMRYYGTDYWTARALIAETVDLFIIWALRDRDYGTCLDTSSRLIQADIKFFSLIKKLRQLGKICIE